MIDARPASWLPAGAYPGGSCSFGQDLRGQVTPQTRIPGDQTWGVVERVGSGWAIRLRCAYSLTGLAVRGDGAIPFPQDGTFSGWDVMAGQARPLRVRADPEAKVDVTEVAPGFFSVRGRVTFDVLDATRAPVGQTTLTFELLR